MELKRTTCPKPNNRLRRLVDEFRDSDMTECEVDFSVGEYVNIHSARNSLTSAIRGAKCFSIVTYIKNGRLYMTKNI